jgi:hypothetical protein
VEGRRRRRAVRKPTLTLRPGALLLIDRWEAAGRGCERVVLESGPGSMADGKESRCLPVLCG